MPIQLKFPPDDITAAMRDAVTERSRRRRFVTPALSRMPREALALTTPHATFTLTLDDLAGDRGLDAATQVGWRYLVRDEDRTIAAAEGPLVAADVDRDLVINEGQFVGGTDAAIRALEDDDEVMATSFELRLLKVPGLYTIAIWLHDVSDEPAGIVLPIGQAHPTLEPNTQYSEDEFVERLRDPAREQLEFDTSPRER